MSELVRLVRGMWVNAIDGEWYFDLEPGEMSHLVAISRSPSFYNLLSIVRETYQLSTTTPVRLTHLSPAWAIGPGDKRNPPLQIDNSISVGIFMFLRGHFPGRAIGVTVGPAAVDCYDFQRRTAYYVPAHNSVFPTVLTVDTQTYRYPDLAPGQYLIGAGRVFRELGPSHMLRNILEEDEVVQYMKRREAQNQPGAPTEDPFPALDGLQYPPVGLINYEKRRALQNLGRASTSAPPEQPIADLVDMQYPPVGGLSQISKQLDFGETEIPQDIQPLAISVSTPHLPGMGPVADLNTNLDGNNTISLEGSSSFWDIVAQQADGLTNPAVGQVDEAAMEPTANESMLYNEENLLSHDWRWSEDVYQGVAFWDGIGPDAFASTTEVLDDAAFYTPTTYPSNLPSVSRSPLSTIRDGPDHVWSSSSSSEDMDLSEDIFTQPRDSIVLVNAEAEASRSMYQPVPNPGLSEQIAMGAHDVEVQTRGRLSKRVHASGGGPSNQPHQRDNSAESSSNAHSVVGVVDPTPPTAPVPQLMRTVASPVTDGVPIVIPSDEETDDDLVVVGNTKHNPGDLYVGMTFPDRAAFKLHMGLYAVKHKFRFRSPTSTPSVMILRCYGKACGWRVYAVKVYDSDSYQVRKLVPTHSCTVDERGGFERQATAGLISQLIRTRYHGVSSGPKPNAVRELMRGDHGVRVSYWKAWRSREIAVDNSNGTAGSSYNLLPTYLQGLMVSNPNSIVEIETDYQEGIGQRFKYLFVALGACIAGYEYMRKVIVIDGTHLKGRYLGTLLTASAQDGDHHIFPLAFAVVDGETDKAWEWFFRHLKSVVKDDKDLVFISDRHASIYAGLTQVYPMARHCACILHLKRNIKTIFKSDRLANLVNKAGRAYSKHDFYETFNKIKSKSPECAEYLVRICLDHWARSHFNGKRYNLMTSNIAESWNKVLLDARMLPIIPLVEFIRSKMMNWFANRRESASKEQQTLTPKVQSIIVKNFEDSTGFDVHKIGDGNWQVRNNEGIAFHVDLINKTCSCYEFQMICVPCKHAVAASLDANVRVDSLVSPEYTTQYWKLAYSQSINPVPQFDPSGNASKELQSIHLFPPKTKRPPGRPRTRRIQSRGENRLGIRRRPTTCGRCKRVGHNRATCTNPI